MKNLTQNAVWHTAVLLIVCMVTILPARDDDIDKEKKAGFEFTIVKEIQTTPVKNQSRTGTCWTFATNSFIETELLRMGKGEYDLSEMFIVRKTYPKKAMKYVRLHGHSTLGPGSLAGDVFKVFREYGMVPEELYSGKFVGESKHNHGEMDAVLRGALDAVIKNRGKKLSMVWPNAIEGILDAYLGKTPESFEYKGKIYSPRTFADALGFNLDDYVEFTSYTHQPFYTQFSIEVPDNWSLNKFYNIPLDEFMSVLDHAIDKGYSIAWDGDVSEKSFSQKKGVAILPLKALDDKTKDEQDKLCDAPEPELEVTQEIRQDAFDNYTSTDDHLMHLTGMAKDQHGTKYYLTKNSWGTLNSKYDGFIYMSESYVRSKTISILIHKEAVPDKIAKRVGLK